MIRTACSLAFFFFIFGLGCAALADVGADDETLPGLHNDSEVGVVMTNGNSTSQSVNVEQTGLYRTPVNLFRLSGKYLNSSAGGVESALYWAWGVRYERELSRLYSAFIGQSEEGDVFSGYYQRYNSDMGIKRFLARDKENIFDLEAGYRFTLENSQNAHDDFSFLRFFSEFDHAWSPTVSTQLNFEYLPNLTIWPQYLFNASIAISVAMNKTLSLKTGYALKFQNVPPPPAVHQADTRFTTALVAKF